MESISSAQNILLVHDQNNSISSFLDDLKQKTSGVIITKLNSEISDKETAKYDFLISNNGVNVDDKLLSIYLKVLKPNGILIVRQGSAQNQIVSSLKLSGFTKVAENEGDISCSKPNFEVGSSAKLSFASPAVWKIDNDDDEDDMIDPDTLLDEDDLKKPDPSSLRVCGTTGKRKACKDCSCGLAEELAGEKTTVVADAPKSSCGSCYLGDAFRCATCPYLGMPAFKPGEKIQLAGNQLQADI